MSATTARNDVPARLTASRRSLTIRLAGRLARSESRDDRRDPPGLRQPFPSNSTRAPDQTLEKGIQMSGTHSHAFPKLHNAAWPGVVGKGEGSEPAIDLDTMLDLTAAAEVDGIKFDGVDLFLFAPHVDIDASDDDLKALAEKVSSRGLKIGSVVAPVWPPTGGGSA